MNHKGNWLGTFLDKFWMNKYKNLLEQDLKLRPPDWRAGALPTSPILAVSLFVNIFVQRAPVRSHETLYWDRAQVTIQPGKRQ